VRVALDVNQVHRVTRLAPLHWAVKHNKLSTARLLLELGAANEPVRSVDQQVRSQTSHPSFFFVLSFFRSSFFANLLLAEARGGDKQYLVTVPPFFLACECQLPDMVQLFLEHFGPGIVDAVVPHSSMTSTPLLRVLQLIQCRKEFVEFLLAKGANVRATTGGPHPKDALTCLLQVRICNCGGVWRVACGVWRVACGAWRVACGVWRVARGVWRASLAVVLTVS
jgi:ankyrin repeat protein